MAPKDWKENEGMIATHLEREDINTSEIHSPEEEPLLSQTTSDVEAGSQVKRGNLPANGGTVIGAHAASTPARSFFGRGVRFYLDSYLSLMLTASLASSLNALCMRVVTQHISVFQIVLIYSTLSLVCLSLFCNLKEIPIFEPRKKIPLFILRGVVGAVGFLFRSFGQFELSVSEFAFVSNSYPGNHTAAALIFINASAVTAAISWAVGIEQLSPWTWLGVFGSLIGNALIAHPPFFFGGHEDWGLHRILGLASACISNVFVAFSFLIIRHAGNWAHPATLTIYMHFFSILCSIPFLAIDYPLPLNTRHSTIELLCYGGSWIGVVVQLCTARALQLDSATKTTYITLTNMVFSCLLGIFVLSEKITWMFGLGAVVTVVSVLAVIAPKTKRPQKNRSLSTVDEEEAEVTQQRVI